MPVYVPRRRVPVKVRAVERHEVGKRRKYLRRKSWGFKKTRLEVVENGLGFRVREHVAELCKHGSPVVVDWGCGNGTATATLAKTNPKARVIGFSKDSYRKWFSFLHGTKRTNPNTNLRFIHAEAADFARYFKNGTIDLMYSSLGLTHLKNLNQYLQPLIIKLKVGGLIVTDVSTLDEHYYDLFRKATKENKGEETIHTIIGNRPYDYAQTTYTYSFPNYEIKLYTARNSTIQIKRTK